MKDSGYDTQQVFQEQLLKGEDILWSGQPDPNVTFTTMDIFLIPFSLFWGGFAIFWEILVLIFPRGVDYGDFNFVAHLIFPLFGIPFVIIGLYLMFGRFIYKKWKKRRTYYAVTNKRLISLSKAWGQHFQEANIKSISGLGKKVRSDGIGTLTFGGSQSFLFSGFQFYANTGLDILTFHAAQLGFFDIKDVNGVHRLITDLRNQETEA